MYVLVFETGIWYRYLQALENNTVLSYPTCVVREIVCEQLHSVVQVTCSFLMILYFSL